MLEQVRTQHVEVAGSICVCVHSQRQNKQDHGEVVLAEICGLVSTAWSLFGEIMSYRLDFIGVALHIMKVETCIVPLTWFDGGSKHKRWYSEIADFHVVKAEYASEIPRTCRLYLRSRRVVKACVVSS